MLVLLMALPTITFDSFDVSHQYGMRMLFWFGRSNCIEIDGKFDCEPDEWMSHAGWEEHLRSFISAASAEEGEPLAKTVLWIHAPDYSRNGVLGDIQNVTNRDTDYAKLWKSINDFGMALPDIAPAPIEKVLDSHIEKFSEAYNSLDALQRATYNDNVSKGKSTINPFNEDIIY